MTQTHQTPTEAPSLETDNLAHAELLGLVAKLRQNQHDLEARRRLDSCVAEFATLLRYQPDDTMAKWAYRQLAFMVERATCLQGALYVIDEKQAPGADSPTRVLNPAAAYAFNLNELENEILVGSGLVGQVAKTGKQRLFALSAEHGPTASTGMVKLQLQALLVHPLVFNDEVLGVLELSSLHAIADTELELLRVLADQVAANLITIQNQDKMRLLLSEVQARANEIEAQEEELRQNLEEMQVLQDRLQEHAHEQSRELSGQLAALHNAAVVSETDVRGNITFCNDTFAQISGYSREELMGQNHRMLKSGHQPQELFIELWQTISKGRVWRGEVKNRRKDGTYYWVWATVTPITDPTTGRAVKYVSVRFDITRIKEMEIDLREQVEEIGAQEEELRQSAEEMKALEEHLQAEKHILACQLAALGHSMAVVEFDMDGAILRANANFLNITGYAAEEVAGQHHSMLVRPEDAASDAYARFWQRLNEGECFEAEFEGVDKHGNSVWLRAFYHPVSDATGKPVKVAKYAANITELKLKALAEYQLGPA